MMRSDMQQRIGNMRRPYFPGKDGMRHTMPIRQAYKKGGMVKPMGQGCCEKGKKPCKMY